MGTKILKRRGATSRQVDLQDVIACSSPDELPIGYLPVTSLIIDAAKVHISTSAASEEAIVAVPHLYDGPGYQRDPRERRNWWVTRDWDTELGRPLEVSARQDGTYAIVDGGGSWYKRVMEGRVMAPCRIHHGLTRKDEADLFVKFDTQRKRLSAVHRFQADLSAGDEYAVDIAEALHPHYVVADSGINAIGSVTALEGIYKSTGTSLIQKAAQLAGNHWGSASGKAGHAVPGNVFVALAAFVEVTRSISFNESKLRSILHEKYVPKTLLVDARKLAGTATKTPQLAGFMVQLLVDAYNMRLGSQFVKIDKARISASKILQRYAGKGNKAD